MKTKLVHYSDSQLNKVDVKKFNNHYFTLNDYKLSNLPRSFFYVNGSQIEQRFKGKIKHQAIVDSRKLYNITENKKNIEFNTIDELLRKVKKQGYLGVVYIVNNLQIANIFQTIKVKRIE